MGKRLFVVYAGNPHTGTVLHHWVLADANDDFRIEEVTDNLLTKTGYSKSVWGVFDYVLNNRDISLISDRFNAYMDFVLEQRTSPSEERQPVRFGRTMYRKD